MAHRAKAATDPKAGKLSPGAVSGPDAPETGAAVTTSGSVPEVVIEPAAADEAAKAVVPQEADTATPAESGPTPEPETGTEGQAAAAGEGSPSSAEAPTPADDGNAPSLEPVWSLIVTGPKSGRRRAGRQFGPEPVTLAVSDLSEAEIAALMTDPALTIQTINAPY
ncbi:MAG: hypothetical protein KF887_07105 [Paracoccaceae bacterium]|nr:MAG: hypothetical protein KF887_07105 [Paracoccaceae bacterium]